MRTQKTIGILLIIGAIGLLVPYTMLTMHFEYPDVLRQDTATILTKFHQGGSSLIFTWFAFALTGIPLIPAYIFMGRTLDQASPWMRVATNVGVIGLIVQLIGLLRWTFVVPVIAESFVSATDEGTKTAAIMAFKTIHQFAGVLLGEHLGQLFTIAWTIIVSVVLLTSRKCPVGSAGLVWGVLLSISWPRPNCSIPSFLVSRFGIWPGLSAAPFG